MVIPKQIDNILIKLERNIANTYILHCLFEFQPLQNELFNPFEGMVIELL